MTLNSSKEYLLKYCYLGSSRSDAEMLKMLRAKIADCDKLDALEFYQNFLDRFIMPYFQLNRPKFNKLRRLFMIEVLKSLVDLSNGIFITNLFYKRYTSWCMLCRIHECEHCSTVYNSIINYYENKQLFF